MRKCKFIIQSHSNEFPNRKHRSGLPSTGECINDTEAYADDACMHNSSSTKNPKTLSNIAKSKAYVKPLQGRKYNMKVV